MQWPDWYRSLEVKWYIRNFNKGGLLAIILLAMITRETRMAYISVANCLKLRRHLLLHTSHMTSSAIVNAYTVFLMCNNLPLKYTQMNFSKHTRAIGFCLLSSRWHEKFLQPTNLSYQKSLKCCSYFKSGFIIVYYTWRTETWRDSIEAWTLVLLDKLV